MSKNIKDFRSKKNHPIAKLVIGYFIYIATLNSVIAAPNDGKKCESVNAIISAEFEAGGMSSCSSFVPSIFRVLIEPEDEDSIGRSPWYAFKITNKVSTPIVVELVYKGGEHRFWPKISGDGRTWSRLDGSMVRVVSEQRIQLFLQPQDNPYYIAAQEIYGNDVHLNWMDNMASRNDISKREIGSSELGRPIYKIESESGSNTKEYIFMIGRQHPAEVPGAWAMTSFIETLYADTDLARRFRDRFGIISVPVVNPDGVALGYWRNSTGGMDLNYTWGPFVHKETLSVKNELDRFKSGDKLKLFIDFHSTHGNLFYTQRGPGGQWPSDMTQRWFAGAMPRLRDYLFEHVALTTDSGHKNSNNYVYHTFNSPTIIFEAGEETERLTIENAMVVFAEELMRVMLSS